MPQELVELGKHYGASTAVGEDGYVSPLVAEAFGGLSSETQLFQPSPLAIQLLKSCHLWPEVV